MTDTLIWAALILVLFVIFLAVFHKPIGRLIDRSSSFKFGKFSAAVSQQEAPDKLKPSAADELLSKTFDNKLLVDGEAHFRRVLEQSKVTDGVERERVLLRYLASVSIAFLFERLYANIWGSQIAALQFINDFGAPGLSRDSLKPWYEQAAAGNKDLYRNYSFDDWLGFLVGMGVVEEKDDQLTLSLTGREFLKYLIHQGHSLYKQG